MIEYAAGVWLWGIVPFWAVFAGFQWYVRDESFFSNGFWVGLVWPATIAYVFFTLVNDTLNRDLIGHKRKKRAAKRLDKLRGR